MLPKIVYIALHYLLLMAFVFSCWGIGKSILQRVLSIVSRKSQEVFLNTLAIALGMGVFICLLQWLGIAGKLQLPWILILLCLGTGAGFMQIYQTHGAQRTRSSIWTGGTRNERWLLLIVALIVGATLLDPLAPPLESDELSYHLPNAQQWAMNGHLGINEWLRYPWFPNNYGLLYAAALIVGSDVLPHLLHACAGWLVALLIYQTGKRYASHGVACLGVIIWFYLARRDFDNAYIDMGVTLFIFAAAIALQIWIEHTKEKAWLLLAAFLAGVAVGCKYQALGFLPLFAVAVTFYERRPKVLLYVAACFLVPCIYWYARNLILTGDPINPIGGKIFGFTNWNADDYALQLQDLKNRSAWPSTILWAALIVPFIKTYRNTQSIRHAMVFCAYSTALWIITSHYPRYLMPTFPILALLAASGWCWLGHQGLRFLHEKWRSHPRLVSSGWVSISLVVLIASSFHTAKSWRKIAPTDTIRDEILKNKIDGYQLLSDLKQHPVGRIYQFGIGEVKYYAPNPIWGDYFGPWRYADFAPAEPMALAGMLKTHDFSHLLINTSIWPEIVPRPGFNDYFEEIRSDGAVTLYRIIAQ